VPALGANATKTGSMTVTLPASIATAGPYFIIAKANGNGAVTEVDATNNTKSRSIIIGPDFVVSALTVQATGGAGLPLTITDTTRNDGAGDAPASTTSYYLSADPTLESSDVLIGSRPVPLLTPGGSNTGSVTVTIPAGTAAGTYSIFAVANTTAISEIDSGNNTRSKQTKIGPDLVISTFAAPASATAGSTITVTDTTSNQGAGHAGPFTVRVYLSTNDDVFDPSVDTPVGSRPVSGVQAGTSNSGPISVTIPNGISGSFTLFAVADADNVVSELLETNNNKSRSLNVLP
jgi:subtilase family serine protease